MSPQDAIELIKLIRERRQRDEQGESWLLDADELEDAILSSVEPIE